MADIEFGALFERFRAMLRPYGERMHVSSDEPNSYGVDMAPAGERDPRWGAAQRGEGQHRPTQG